MIGSHKAKRMMDLAEDGGHPLVMVVEGGGHRIQDGLDARSFAVGGAWRIGGWLEGIERLSGWVPTVAIVPGVGFAGPANLAARAARREGLAVIGVDVSRDDPIEGTLAATLDRTDVDAALVVARVDQRPGVQAAVDLLEAGFTAEAKSFFEFLETLLKADSSFAVNYYADGSRPFFDFGP